MSLYMSTRSNFESLHVNSNVIASRDISLSDSTVMGLYTSVNSQNVYFC